MKKWVIINRVVIFCAGVFFIVWIFDQHIPFAGVRVIEYTSGVPNSIVTRPHPLDRVETHEKEHVEKIIEDPVYFEVKTSVPYERVTLIMRTQNHATVPLKVGLKRSEQGNDVSIQPLLHDKSDGDWSIDHVSFDLAGSLRVSDRYYFLLSLPGVQYEYPERGYALLSTMTITLERPGARWADYTRYFRKTFSL